MFPSDLATWALLYPMMVGLLKKLVRNETNHLIADGVIYRPECCQLCGEEKPVTAHHIQYDVQGTRYVEFLCRDCHDYVHRPVNQAVKGR